MLWQKSWLETRWRFLIGFVVLVCAAMGAVLSYPRVLQLMPMVPAIDTSTEIGRRIKAAADLAREYRGYVWSNWFDQNLLQMWTLFAAIIGTGGLTSQAAGGGALFTLSLPATRTRLAGVRAATGLAELFALAILPSLLIPLLSPAIDRSYSVTDAIVHGLCLFAAGATFFSLAFLLSTVFTDVWRPALITMAIASALAVVSQVTPELERLSIFRVMSAESFFRGHGLPWIGLVISIALSAAMFFAAARNIVEHDF